MNTFFDWVKKEKRAVKILLAVFCAACLVSVVFLDEYHPYYVKTFFVLSSVVSGCFLFTLMQPKERPAPPVPDPTNL